MSARLLQVALLSLTPTLFLTAPAAGSEDGAEYLVLGARGYETRHTLRFHFSAGDGWRMTEPAHRSARFNDVPFEVSLSAFLRDDEAIMIHAEHVADQSGAANYDRFPATDWPVGGFRGEQAQCHEFPASVVAEEHDLAWLDRHGFSPVGAMWIEQHFLSGNNYNDEIVVSLIVRGESCDDADEPAQEFARMRESLSANPR
ncbi:hypothetical protein [Maricaulis sp.]|uniref:hypothetical protein n=1 Tax=Maricaulis sp. TaxID=1486257 RepID=UPI0025BBB840|nr:hypothetical protein [Maricaulis sp.]